MELGMEKVVGHKKLSIIATQRSKGKRKRRVKHYVMLLCAVRHSWIRCGFVQIKMRQTKE
jgi:hypothetical protein